MYLSHLHLWIETYDYINLFLPGMTARKLKDSVEIFGTVQYFNEKGREEFIETIATVLPMAYLKKHH